MTLTKEQIKIAKTTCKEAGLNPKMVTGQIGAGFWAEKCNSTFEGYVNWIKNGAICNPSNLQEVMDKSLRDYRAGRYGASAL